MNFKKFAELCEMELDDFLSDMFTGTGYAINAKNDNVLVDVRIVFHMVSFDK